MSSIRLLMTMLSTGSLVAGVLGILENPTAACQSLTVSLGAGKTATSMLDLRYIDSRNSYWNQKLNAHAPACVVYPENTQDVSLALKAIKATGSRFAIKAAGHNTNDLFSAVDGGVLIDLSHMNGKSYDESTTLATYEPGSTWGDLYGFYLQYGRTVVGGRVHDVGTGLALGGGMSFLSPQYGMACDSFRELEVVLPSGDIVKASSTENSDLFFGLRGGGGNSYGVVTKYTVQSRPIGTLYAGNVLYALDHRERILNATRDFILYNTDPKAAILMNFNILSVPDLELGLDQACLMFLVYDGVNPGNAFANFTAIPHILNTLGPKTYLEVANLPVPKVALLSRADNVFRIGVHRADDASYRTAFDRCYQWAQDNKGDYTSLHLDYNPVAKSLTDASRSQGGNAMEMPDGPWFWAEYTLTTPPLITTEKYNQIQASFKAMVEGTPNAAGLPYFLNEAHVDQDALKTFSSYPRLQQIKQKYDPDGFFASKTGGWSFS
ncbi:putative berberine berberine-like [Rosellinia necatrix]|uniref:Putative berberine berberine-like n=1 Tax=Rosellinia necatrix TaxID=77044 RepID=A0A1W2TR13_ROSNE|nr:putative berberine berberine-like [Rosellinia necatrix]